MSSRAEVLSDPPESREEALGMAGGLEAAHRAFPLACRLVRVLGAVIEPPVTTMLNARHDLLLRCFIAPKFVGNHHARHVLAAFEQLAEELLGRGFVPS